MKNSTLTLCLSAALMVGAATETLAGGKHMGPRHSFEELDTNSDGQITQEEMTAHRTARFNETDTDGDGKLSKAEITAKMEGVRARKIDKMFSHKDSDGDGMISLAEMQQGRGGKMFAKADADGNGAISKEEYEAIKARHGKHGYKKDEKAE